MVKLIYNSYWHLYFFPKVKNFVQSKYFIFYYLFIDLWINHNDRIDIFSFLFLIIFYKSIKHPRRISSHPAQIQHPTRPFSVFLSLLIFFSPFFLILVVSLHPLFCHPNLFPLLPLLRRGRFLYHGWAWFIKPWGIGAKLLIFLLHSISKLLYCCCSISNRISCFHSNWKKESSQRTPFCFSDISYTIAHKKEI